MAETTSPAAERPPYVPERLHTITPYLAVSDARAAIAWYQDVFAAQIESEPIIMDDQRVGHVELRVGDSVFMMSDEFAEIDVRGPTARGGTSVALVVYVPDVDRVFAHALDAGGVMERPVEDQFHGSRAGWLRDPWGHRWNVCTPLASVPTRLAERNLRTAPVNLGYYTVHAPDGQRASAFYSQAFGWDSTIDTPGGGQHVANITPPGGVQGGSAPPSISVFFRVADIRAAIAKIRALGGDATEPELHPSGWNASCHDDQGVEFKLWEPAQGY